MKLPENEYSGRLGLTHEGYFDQSGDLHPCTVLRVRRGMVWIVVMSWEETGRPMTLDAALDRVIEIIRQAHEVAERRGPIGGLRKTLAGTFLPRGGDQR